MFKKSTLLAIGLIFFVIEVQASLINRGGGFVYDNVLNITWLQDANYAKTSGYDDDGKMSWVDAKAWASNLVIFDALRGLNYDDWRLASNLPGTHPFHYQWWFELDDSAPTQGPHSELSYMYYVNLGLIGYASNFGSWGNDFGVFGNGSVVGQNNVSMITNLQAGEYISDSNFELYPYNRPWVFNTNNGNHGVRYEYDQLFVWAVRDGDIGYLPEPLSYNLIIACLASWLATARLKRKNH